MRGLNQIARPVVPLAKGALNFFRTLAFFGLTSLWDSGLLLGNRPGGLMPLDESKENETMTSLFTSLSLLSTTTSRSSWLYECAGGGK